MSSGPGPISFLGSMNSCSSKFKGHAGSDVGHAGSDVGHAGSDVGHAGSDVGHAGSDVGHAGSGVRAGPSSTTHIKIYYTPINDLYNNWCRWVNF